MAEVERTRKMNKVKLERGENPAKMFEHIKAIDNQFSDLANALTEDAKIATVLEKGSEEYGVILANTVREKGPSLIMDHLENAMKIQWRILSNGAQKKNGGREISLASFDGTCYECGKIGHKAANCPEKKKNGGQGNSKGKFTGTCRVCGKVGHKAAQCWYNEKNMVK